jgi:predicted metalloprotease with PDZ domain
VILNVIGVSGGGLEHHDSALLMTDRFRTKDDEAYRDWLALVSHEIFHAWNGKRLRPVALGPFDYEREVYTKELWVVEGLTSYYDDLVLARAGLITEAQYLERLSRHIHDVERAPGREHQTLAEASFDAWIDFYRRDERTSNTSVSYYAKGALVGFLIDASIRRETHESKSLDDVLREAYGRWSGPTGYRTDELYSLFEEIGGPRTRARLVDMVETTQPLDYGLAFELYGLELEPEDDDAKAKGYLGVLHERTMVTEVVEGAPAARAGISPRDEIIGVGGYRVEDLGEAVGRHRPGDAVDILLSRRGRLMTTTATLASRPREEHRLRFEKARSAAEIRRFERLLGVR